jgi:hypothetical protein
MDLLAQFIEPHFVDESFYRALNLPRGGLRLRVVTVCCCYDADALKFEAPVIARSAYSRMTIQPSASARRRQLRIWSSMLAARCCSLE